MGPKKSDQVATSWSQPVYEDIFSQTSDIFLKTIVLLLYVGSFCNFVFHFWRHIIIPLSTVLTLHPTLFKDAPKYLVIGAIFRDSVNL